MERHALIEHLRSMAESQSTPSDMLKFMTIDLAMTDQVDIMYLFSESMNVTLGEVTAIAAWWHEGERELNDNDIDAYMGPIVEGYVQNPSGE